MIKHNESKTEKNKKKESLLEKVEEELTEPLIKLDGKEEFPVISIIKEEN